MRRRRAQREAKVFMGDPGWTAMMPPRPDQGKLLPGGYSFSCGRMMVMLPLERVLALLD